MAVRGWGGSLATAVGVAAGAGAAQLGLGYGLGIVTWLPSKDPAGAAAWSAGLVWAVWIAATSTVVGAICAVRLGSAANPVDGSDDRGPTSARNSVTGLRRLGLAVAAAIGGLVTVVLVAVPARTATGVDVLSPQTVAAGYAVVGVLLGLLVAIWATSSPAVAGNVLGTTAWLWSLAVAAVVQDVLSDGGPFTARLGVWRLTTDDRRFWFGDQLYWPAAVLALGSALLIGVLAARSAARRPGTRVGAAISGMAGPALVAAGYLVVAPRLTGTDAGQLSAHLIAPYAVVAGVAGSALVAALAQRAESLAGQAGTGTRRSGTPPALPGPSTVPGTESEPPVSADPTASVQVPSQPTAGTKKGDPTGTGKAVPTGTRKAPPAGTGKGVPAGSDEGDPAGGGKGVAAGTAKAVPAGSGEGDPGGGGNGGPAESGEPGDESKPAGKLGRFGRRSR